MLPRRHGFLSTKPRFEPSILPGDMLPCAGAILSDPSRRSDDGTLFIVHPNEPYLLAAAVLRLKGIYGAYPARVFDGEDTSQLILLTDFNDAKITTFRMLRVHPDMEHIDIISDTAMMGSLHAMNAITAGNFLATDLVRSSLDGKGISLPSIERHLEAISDHLFQYCMAWSEPGAEKNILLHHSLDVIMGHITQAEGWKGTRRAFDVLPTGRKDADLFLASRGIIALANVLPVNPEHAGRLLDMDETVLEPYFQFAGQVAGAWASALRTASQTVAVIQDMLRTKLEAAQAASTDSG
jgi:hypothetical protein